MKIVAKKDRKLLLINTGNTQNENKAETIELTVPEEYEDYNKKIVFVTDDGVVWDIIQDNTYKLTKAITKYKQVDFYIWLTKGDVDFRSKTMPLRFYRNEDASDEITPEEISGVNTVVNILEEEITKVDSLETELRALITDIQNKLDNGEFDGQDGYTPQKGIDYFTQEDIEEIETDVKNDLEENVLVNYSLIAETGAKIELSINTTDYKLKAILKDKNNATICTSNEIDLPLETMVVNATYDNTTKKIILTLQNGTTVEFSVADLVSGLVSESQLQTILANYYTKTEINNLLANKVDKVAGKGLSTNDFTDEYKEQVDTNTEDIEDIQEEQTEQNTDIEALQTENARLKATLPTTGEVTGQAITLNKTAELEFKKPPLPMGNSEQVQYSGKQLFDIDNLDYKENISTATGTISNNKIKATLSTDGQFKYAVYFINNPEKWLGKSLTISCKAVTSGSNNGRILLRYHNPGNVFGDIANLPAEGGSFTVDNNLPTGATTIGIYFYANQNSNIHAQGDYVEYSEILVKETSITDDTYEPYTNGASPNPDYPQEITNVTGDVEVKVQNKNLFDGEFELGTIDNSGVKQNSSTAIRTVNFIPINPNTQYILSSKATQIRSVFYDKDYRFVGTHPASFTSKENEYYMKFVLSSTDLQTEAQLEKGSTATEHVEHKEQTFTFPLGNEKLMLGDYLADDGIHHVRKQTELTEDNIDLVYRVTSQYGVNCANIRKDALGYKTAWGSRYCLINKYSEISTVQEVRSGTFGTVFDQIYLRIFDDRFTDTETAKQLLIGTIIEILLAEEEVDPYTQEQQEVYNQIKQALSYEEQTNISSNTIALFNVEAYQDAKVILAEKGTYSKPSTGIPKTDLASAVQTSLNKADSAIQEHQDISGKQDITDNTLTTINKTVPTAINEVNSIAKLANQAKSFSTYQAFINYLNTAEKTEFIPGQSFMIQTKLIPDLWVYSVENTSVQYTYTTDEDFITYTNQATGGQVGYYKLAQLETQKVDLTDYVTFNDYATSSTTGVVKTNPMYGVSTSSYTQNITATTKTYDQYQSSNNATFVGKGTLENVITGKNLESANNKTTTISSSSTDNEYPSAKAVYDYIQSILNNGGN